MALSKDEVMGTVRGFLERVSQRHDVRGAYLFGSCAKGMRTDHSDVDLAIVLGDIRKPEGSPYDESFEIFHEAQEYSSLLEVVCFTKEEFDQESGTLVKQIKKDSVKLL